MNLLPLLSLSSDLNLQKMSGVNWREVVLTWSCESEGSGEILYEENVSDLLSGVL